MRVLQENKCGAYTSEALCESEFCQYGFIPLQRCNKICYQLLPQIFYFILGSDGSTREAFSGFVTRMKSFFLVLFLMLPVFLNGQYGGTQIVMTMPTIESSESSSIVSMALENNLKQSLIGARVLIILTDSSGKVVGNKAEWMVGEKGKPPALPSKGRQEFRVGLKTNRKPAHAQVIFTRLILEDGTLLNPAESVKLKELDKKSREDGSKF